MLSLSGYEIHTATLTLSQIIQAFELNLQTAHFGTTLPCKLKEKKKEKEVLSAKCLCEVTTCGSAGYLKVDKWFSEWKQTCSPHCL